jgi:hypothetical protein
MKVTATTATTLKHYVSTNENENVLPLSVATFTYFSLNLLFLLDTSPQPSWAHSSSNWRLFTIFFSLWYEARHTLKKAQK